MRTVLRITGVLLTGYCVGWAMWWVLSDPRSPLPPEWHPFTPLDVSAPPTWWTPSKLNIASATEATCLAALTPAASVQSLPPLIESETCGIDPRVAISRVGQSQIAQLETTCAVALRTAMWERHVLQPAAQVHFGQAIARLHHQGSYNCRTIRGGARMSTHATAQALDIRAITLDDGRVIPLLGNYDVDTPTARFWRDARDGACTWFKTVLGPEFNALHADHFHLQSVGWGACR